MKVQKNTFLLFTLVFLFSNCKKDPEIDPLGYVILPKQGIIRIECAACSLNYIILNTDYTIEVKNSQDISFSYISNFELKTTINSPKKQSVRLTIFDAYGRIISNELNRLDAGDRQTDSFKIKLE